MGVNTIKTFDNVLDTLVAVCRSHPWINTATHGDPWELSPAGNVVYPLAMVVPTNVQAQNKQIVYNFNVMVMDLVEPGEGVQEKRVLSQTCSALIDIIAYFKRGGAFFPTQQTPAGFRNTNDAYNYTNLMETEFSLEPFTEKFTDNVAGWNMNFSVTMAHDYSVCFWDGAVISGLEIDKVSGNPTSGTLTRGSSNAGLQE